MSLRPFFKRKGFWGDHPPYYTSMPEKEQIKGKFKILIESNFKKFFKHAYIQTGCKETAKDLVQETFLVAYEKLDSFKGASSLETWIFGILNNKILEHYRKKETEKKYIDWNPEEVLFHKNGKWKREWLMDDIEEKENEKYKGTILKFLKQCFSNLSMQYQKVFTLKFFSEKNTQEICKICNFTPDNVWQILHRGKLQLKVCIQSHLKKLK